MSSLEQEFGATTETWVDLDGDEPDNPDADLDLDEVDAAADREERWMLGE